MSNTTELKEKKIYDVVIVGGGPGGYTAAIYARRAGLSAIVLEKTGPGGQLASTDRIENYPGYGEGVEGFDLAMKIKGDADRFGAESKTANVTGFELDGDVKKAVTSAGDFFGRTVILATGASPRKLGLPREDELVGRGVGYCAVCDGNFFRGKTVAVIGGANSAAANAIYLSSICEKVYMVHRRPVLNVEKKYIDEIEKAGNIELVLNSKVKEIQGDSKVSAIVVEGAPEGDGSGKERTMEISGLFVAVGRIPNTAEVKDQVELDRHGYIVAGEDTKTSVPGVFAVGDVRTKPLRQVITAASDGAVASKFAGEYIRSLGQE